MQKIIIMFSIKKINILNHFAEIPGSVALLYGSCIDSIRRTHIKNQPNLSASRPTLNACRGTRLRALLRFARVFWLR
jgi:hypothetical protein